MGKKNKGNNNLGRALIKDRFGSTKGKKMVENNTMLHTTELQDGYDWGRLNLQSVTEESSFQEFLATAELAGTEFQGEKLNIAIINPKSNVGLLSADETKKMRKEQEQHKEFIKIPRRPAWNSETTPEELDKIEKESFLEWRRSLALLQENEGLLLTPFEKNLEFWRQLWRVVERSDVVIQIVDGRNPLLFRCEDLEKYVKEISKYKLNAILINKADYLTEDQRQHWANYFEKNHIRVLFYSALQAAESLNKIDEENSEETQLDEVSEKFKTVQNSIENINEEVEIISETLSKLQSKIDEIINNTISKNETENKSTNLIKNSSKLLTKEELIEVFKNIYDGPTVTKNVTTIGLVGYPNVGKSSTINSLLSVKKVSVSATPGKTKHFQTLYLDKDLLLCDCPGLVMPSFVFTKAEMILNGILPIDQLKDHVPPINLLTTLIPKHILQDKYGIMLPRPPEEEDPNRPPTSEELLNAYGYIRGFMTANGQPDNPRAARYILKDFVNGKLLYCHAPPGVPQEKFHTFPEKVRSERPLPPREQRAIKPIQVTGSDLDKAFFATNSKGVHAKGVPGKSAGVPVSTNENNAVEKPWKKANRHGNKNKREKLRRVYAHLDQH